MVTCNICNKEFETYKELSRHLVQEHSFNTTRLYDYYNYSFETGKAICPICGKEFIMIKRQIDGFKKNPNKSIGCCTSCSKSIIMITHGSPLSNPETYKKTKETLRKNYGVEHPAQSNIIRDKMKKTNFERYGVENTFEVKEFQDKAKQTNFRKYGTEYAIGSKEIRGKAKETLLKNYGVDNAFKSEEIKNKIKETNLKNLGVEHPAQAKEVFEKMKQTNIERYGVELPLQSKEVQENMKNTNLEKYGVEYVVQLDEVKQKSKDTMLEKYGVEYSLQSPEIQERIKKKSLEQYGTEYYLQAKPVRDKASKTTMEKYGVEYFCQHEDCFKNNHRRISKVNKKFQELLNGNNIDNELEFIVEDSGYDLKVNNTLIEIDPWFTHNSTVGPTFGSKTVEPKPTNYHLEKAELAHKNGYNCIHIFDWDNWNKVISLLQSKSTVYARNCEVNEIKNKEVKEFLDLYHLQGSTKSLQHAYGLFYKDELVEVMTFGKPRYNKNYEYELLRLCTKPEFKVIGGASKLLKHFEQQVKPSSIISYCDLSKFSGDVYEKLGFKLSNKTTPARHWYNPKTKRHISDNLLRQRGFDQLHNANFGKGTSNEELMIEHGYVEIYDCGQLVFVK